jgi:uridine phosphorylase
MESYLLDRYLRLPDGSLPHVQVRPGEVGTVAILCGSPRRVERVSERLAGARRLSGDRGYTVYVGGYRGEAITVANSGLGCPSVAVAAEELIAAGARALIRAGSCASIDPSLPIGDLLIATAAVPDEGTSPYYGSDGSPSPASSELVTALRSAAKALDRPVQTGTIRSTDSFYEGERKREIIDHWRSENVCAFDMESSALFTVARALGSAAAAILVAGSNLVLGTSTYQGVGAEAYRAGEEEMIEVALEAAARLAPTV